MYQIGDFIIYGNHGVYKVDGIGTPGVCGIDENKLYYTISAVYGNERIFTPVDTNVFMRKIITFDEVQQLISLIPSIKESVYCNRNIKLVEDHYQEYLQAYDCRDLVELIKSIYTKKTIVAEQGKKLGQIDERFMRKAEELLYGELAVALKIPKESVKGYIEERVKEFDNAYLIKC
ncbi:CarD family transcriptional regulator [Acetivibrio cellulolyticus]|uniref:CarD family transcriptional regulator n=1 Tax=Acetivibrio cellulolyticus TaxID=35830 RepID=UPI0001E2F14F|nr:CarD family transcriptional regulator [Acetivibrio cellulolyticus]